MNIRTEKSAEGHLPVARATRAASGSSTKTLATWILAAGVAGLVVTTDQLIDHWAQTHAVAAWLALWGVAVVAIAALRGVTRLLAQNLMTGLDAWSAHVARRRADQRLWAMAQSDSRMMRDLQTAMDRAEDTLSPAADVSSLMGRRVARMVNSRLDYI
jgi:hypothetical protein